MPRRFINKQERNRSYMKRGQLFHKKKILVPTLTLVMMMFAFGIGPATPQEVLAATTDTYIEMTVDVPEVSISQHSVPTVQATNQTDRWQGSGDSWKLLNESRNGYVTNSWFQDLDSSWYMLGSDGTMYSGLVTDQSTGKSYLLNTNHDGTYGRMLTQNGTYTVNGKSVYLTFNQAHDGSYGAILTGLSEARSSGVNEVSLPSIPTDSQSQPNVDNNGNGAVNQPGTDAPAPPSTEGGNNISDWEAEYNKYFSRPEGTIGGGDGDSNLQAN